MTACLWKNRLSLWKNRLSFLEEPPILLERTAYPSWKNRLRYPSRKNRLSFLKEPPILLQTTAYPSQNNRLPHYAQPPPPPLNERNSLPQNPTQSHYPNIHVTPYQRGRHTSPHLLLQPPLRIREHQKLSTNSTCVLHTVSVDEADYLTVLFLINFFSRLIR